MGSRLGRTNSRLDHRIASLRTVPHLQNLLRRMKLPAAVTLSEIT